jgi:hypothetical protein
MAAYSPRGSEASLARLHGAARDLARAKIRALGTGNE